MTRRVTLLFWATLFFSTLLFAQDSLSSPLVAKGPVTIRLESEIVFLIVLLLVLMVVVSSLATAFVVWFVKVRNMNHTDLRFDMVMETASVDHQLGGELQIIVFSTTDHTVPNAFSSVHKRMSSCFREIGFQVFFADTFQIQLEKIPTLIAVNVKQHKKPLKMVERFMRKHKNMMDVPVIFYNLPDPSSFDFGHKLTSPYLLGKNFKDQDLVKIASTAVEAVEKQQPDVLHGTITGDGIIEILQLLELGKRSGLLRIRDMKKQLLGELGFHLGVIVFARSARGVGGAAAIDIVDFTNGHFGFHAQDIEEHNCEILATSLILQAAQLHDEQQHGLAQAL